MAEPNTVLIWQPLKSPTSTRLLHVHPASETDSNIRASLIEVDLAEGPKYEAVSWTWGTDLDEQPIWVDDKKILIRDNLWRFLRRLRRSDGRNRILWVDAISINQKDNDEKSLQVAIIGEIFKQAESVVAWVGEAADGSEELFQRLSQRQQLLYLDNTNAYAEYEKQITRESGIIDENGRLQTWKSFLNRPWFSRTWIVQETVVAKQLLIHCGSSAVWWDQIPWFPLQDRRIIAVDGINTSRFENDPEVKLAFARLEELHRERDHFWNSRAGTTRFVWWGIHRIAETFSYRQCMDRRDRVYALLAIDSVSLASDEAAIQPDYNLSIEGVFLSVFRQRYKTAWGMEPNQNRALPECEDAAELAMVLAEVLGLGSATEVAKLLRDNMCQSDDAKVWAATLRSLDHEISKAHA